MSSMFSGCSALGSLGGISNWNTGSVTNMSSMFSGCASLASVDGLSGWDTGSVTNMSKMFNGCSALDSLGGLGGLSNWNTSSVKNMSSMFQNCTKLTSTSLDVLSNWNTKIGSVTDMSNMFSGCTSLDSLDGLSGWVTSGVTNMSNMFSGCTSLNSLDGLSGWNTKMGSVTTMSNMFSGCTSLASVDLSGWDTKKVTYTVDMFNGCSALTTIAVCDWNTGVQHSSGMFTGCTRLEGGKGTIYSDDNPTDKTYARVDGGSDDPGYFTGKPAFRGCYLVLSGKIGVTFTLEVPQHFDAAGAYVAFTVGGRDAGNASLSGLTPGADGRYSVPCGVTSLEMADEVKATLHWNGEAKAGTATASYSVERYADYVVGHETEPQYSKVVPLARAINDYGYYAQLWLSKEHHFDLGAGGKYAAMKKAYTEDYDYDDVKTSASTYAITKDLGGTGVTASYRLHLDSATGISVLVRPGSGALAEPSGTLQPSPGSGDVAKQADVTQQSDGTWVLRLDGIPAHRLADKLMVTGAAGSEQFSVEVCALSYVWTVFNKPSGTVPERDAMAAFLEYYEASIAYKNGGATA
jgi:surface protein